MKKLIYLLLFFTCFSQAQNLQILDKLRQAQAVPVVPPPASIDTTSFVPNGLFDLRWNSSTGSQYQPGTSIVLSTDTHIIMIFDEVNIPVGSTINSAKVQLSAYANVGTASVVNIICEKGIDPYLSANVTGDIMDRTFTTASQTWNVPAWTINDRGADQLSADFSTVLQEVIDDYSYAKGHRIAVTLQYVSGGGPSIKTYENLPADAGELIVNYTPPAVQAITSVIVPIDTGSDDAEQYNTSTPSLTDTDMDLGYGSSTHITIGLRFNGANIPQGAIIKNAYIQFTQRGNPFTGAINLYVQGEASDNPPTFAAVQYDLTDRTRTTASVLWQPDDWVGATFSKLPQRTPDLKTVVQEIVNRGTYTSTDSLVFLIEDDGVTLTSRSAASFEDPIKEPILYINYETP